jgi:hypothetical protein
MAEPLTAIAETAVAEYMRSPAAAEKVAAVVKKEVDKAIEEALGWSSEFRKTVNAAVSKALKVHGDIDLPSYNETILKIVARQVETSTRDSIEKEVARRMKDLLTPAPETIKLSELAEQYQKFLKEQASAGCVCYGEVRFAVQIEEADQYGYRSVLFDKDGDRTKRKYEWDIRLGVTKEGRIYNLAFQNQDVNKVMFAGPFYAFERSLFQMKAAGTLLQIDVTVDDIDTNYGGES